MKNLFKFKERLAGGVRRYGRVLSLIVTLTALSSSAWGTTYYLYGGTQQNASQWSTTPLATSETLSFTITNSSMLVANTDLYIGASTASNGYYNNTTSQLVYDGWSDKSGNVSSISKQSQNNGSNCQLKYLKYKLSAASGAVTVTLQKDGTYNICNATPDKCKYTLGTSSAPTPTTTVPSIRIGKKAVVDGTNVTFNGQIADWGCENVTKVTVYYSTSGNPTKISSKKEITLSPAIGSNTNTGNLNTEGWASGTYTYALTATNGKGESELSDFGTFTVQACTPPTVTTLPQLRPNQNIDDPKVISARYSISGGTCDITSAGVNVYVDASCTNKKYTITNSASGSTTKDANIAFNVTLKENTIYYIKAFVTLDGGSTVESATAQTYFTFPVFPTTTGVENTDCGKFAAKASTDLTSKESGGTAKFSSYSVTFRVWDNSVAVNGYGTPNTYYTKTASSVSGTEARATFNIASDTRYDDKTTKMQMGSTYKYIAYYTLSEVAFSDGNRTMYSRTYSGTYAPKSFTIPAPSITPDVNSITFATHVVLGQESSALKIANYTFCGHSFTTSDFALTGDNATDFTLTQQSVSSGTAYVKIRFTPKSGIGAKSANLVVKEGGNVISTIPVSATADCIIPTKANYSVSGNVHTYDGLPKTAVITPNTGSTYGDFITGTATYGGQPSQTNVGEYTIHYTVPAGGNYCAANFDFDEKLTINKATLPEITDLPSGATKCADETLQLSPVCAGATLWEYSSSNTSIATVSNDGLITFEGAGNATITVTAKAPNYYNKTKNVSVTTIAGPVVSASAINTTAYEVITLTSTSGSVLWSKDAADTKAYFVKNNQAVDDDTVEAVNVNFKAPAKDGDYTVTAKDGNDCTSNISITISEPHEVCN